MDTKMPLMSNSPPLLANDIPPTWTQILTPISSLSPVSRLLLFFLVFNLILVNLCFFRLASVLNREPVCRRPPASPENPTHLLVVLGSGGHTAEMLNILAQYQGFQRDWTYRTYVISSGDGFSASKAHEFEDNKASEAMQAGGLPASSYNIVTVHRARRVHQSLITTPISSLKCLLDCIKVLRGTHPESKRKPLQQIAYPDLILTNGPGTGVIVILASIVLLFFGFTGPSASLPRSKKVMKHASSLPLPIPIYAARSGQMRTIYIESWARVKTLSLSGKLLKPLVDRFLVQWPQLAEEQGGSSGGKAGFVGSLVT